MLLATTACGRIDFDTLADASSVDALDAPQCSHDAPFTSIKELTPLNSASFGEGGLRLSADELTAYFHSDRPPTPGIYQLYTAKRAGIGDPFDAPVSLNQSGFFPFETVDGKALIWDDSDHMYMSTRSDATQAYDLTQQQTILMSPNSDQHAYVSADGTQLYYVLDVQPMLTDFPPTGPGSSIDPSPTGFEHRPVISADGLALYFGALGTPERVFVARRSTPTDVFSQGAVNVIAELADPTFPTGPTWISLDNCRLYLETSRPANDYGLWVAERDPN